MSQDKGVMYGKPWHVESTCENYQEADQRRNKLLGKKEKELQVKVRRSANGTFRVMTRVLVEPTTKKKKRVSKKKKP